MSCAFEREHMHGRHGAASEGPTDPRSKNRGVDEVDLEMHSRVTESAIVHLVVW